MTQDKQPRNIFEQILFGQQVTNDNIIALADNLNVLREQLEILIGSMTTVETFVPNASGAEVE